MTTSFHDGDWRERVESMLGAATPRVASLEATSMLDMLLPGGSAVDVEGAPNFLASLPGHADLERQPNRAYVISILVNMALWIDSFRRVNPDTSLARREEWLENDLIGFCDEYSKLLDDPDPEVRSMMILLIGSLLTSRDAQLSLFGRVEGELHPLVEGCGVQGLIRMLDRVSGEEAAEIGSRIGRILADASDEVLARANLELKGNWRTDREAERLSAKVSVPYCSIPPTLWPAESI